MGKRYILSAERGETRKKEKILLMKRGESFTNVNERRYQSQLKNRPSFTAALRELLTKM